MHAHATTLCRRKLERLLKTSGKVKRYELSSAKKKKGEHEAKQTGMMVLESNGQTGTGRQARVSKLTQKESLR